MDPVQLFDRVPLSSVKRDGAGNLIAPDATVAKTGIYEYAGYELGRPEMRRIRIYRPAEEVFSRDTMRSLAGIPVTIDHPKELVTPSNWRDHAKGETSSDDIIRDGEAVKVPFILRDENAIKAVEDGKHELSPGYTAVIDFTAGQTETGEAYDAVARSLRYNHLAIVDKARGGSDCRIGDEEPREITVDTKTILVDGFQVEVTPQAETAITKLQDSITTLTTERDTANTKLADAEKAKSTLEGEKAALEKQLKDATDPAALQAAATARASLCEKAKVLVPSITLDGKTDAEIRKLVVDAKLGDAAKGMDEAAISGAFTTLAATVKTKAGDTLTDAILETGMEDADSIKKLVEDRNKADADRRERMSTAYLGGTGNEE